MIEIFFTPINYYMSYFQNSQDYQSQDEYEDQNNSAENELKLGNQKVINRIQKHELIKQTNIQIGKDNNGVVLNNDIINISFLKECVALKKLSLFFTKVTNLPLQNITKLKFVWIYQCETLKNINDLENCIELEELNIDLMKITSIAVIEKLKKLKKIIICCCDYITDYNVLENCTNLNYLHIGSTNISDISAFVNMQNLELLKLSNNKQLPQKFREQINDKQKILQFLKDWKETQQFKDYVKKNPSQRLDTEQKINNTVIQKALTDEELTIELKNKVQEKKYQSQQEFQNQNNEIKLINKEIDQWISQTNQQNLNIKEQLQQQGCAMNSLMQQFMQQMNDMNQQLLQQIQQIQTNQKQNYGLMNKALQQITIQQVSDNQAIQKHLSGFIDIFQNNQ